MMERRYKIIYLNPTVILNCFNRSTEGMLVKISFDIPEDVTVAHRSYCPSRMAEVFVLSHPSWPIIPEGEVIPELKASHSYFQIKTHEPVPLVGYLPTRFAKPVEGGIFRMTHDGNQIAVKAGPIPFEMTKSETLKGVFISNAPEKVVDVQGNIGYKVPLNITVKDSLEKEFFDEALGEPHEIIDWKIERPSSGEPFPAPFTAEPSVIDETWRDRPPLF